MSEWKRWLVTGGAGFIGSNFIRHLLSRRPGVEVVNLDKLTYAGNRDNLADLDASRHRLVVGDICDREAVAAAMAGVDAVVNFAAETHVDRSLLDASAFVRTDVEGAFVLLEAARVAGVRRFVHISTDEVYGSRDEGSFREDELTNPRNPYAASKLGGDRLAFAYHATHGMPVVIVRPSNNYGPFQHVEKFVPLFTTNAILGRPLPLYGDGRNVRDWLFVEDNCRAILLIAEHGRDGEVYNIGGGNERPNREVAERIVELLGKPKDSIHLVTDRVGHDRRYSIDSTKLRALGYEPQTSFEAGLAATVSWYREHESWWRKVRDTSFDAYYQRQYGQR